MPPQQPGRPLDVFNDGLNFRAHLFLPFQNHRRMARRCKAAM
jgi:hypothetical protein